ncbi:hypothetical protein EST38_g5553 [Candolleomyces aberdarensis]|uniref:Hydrophobin n=1 Tax=Candolleomyces aberdarensis TaxID=2316362 RepID=A0A4Q2DM70_9AGAR|nr:hypothetical protein EST38_g5553 [Candolleomyces aberdarensis]
MRTSSMVKTPVALLLLLLAMFQLATATTALKNRHDFAERSPEPVNYCKPGHSQCCDTIAMRDDTVLGHLLNKIGGAVDDILEDLNGLIGYQCNPIDILDLTQPKCANKPVCCSGMKLNGLVAVGCNPINIL